MPNSHVLLRAVGTSAVLLEVGAPGEVAGWSAVVAALVSRGVLPEPVEVVPGARTLLLDGVDPAAWRRELALVESPALLVVPADVEVVELSVVYDGSDLAEVARVWGTTEQGVINRHTATTFTVAFCGFAPGFAYLTGLSGVVPRRSTPRASLPAGSVALAGPYCGVYPRASPGGWQLIGRTDAELFDPDRDPAALLPPGTRVRFVARPDLTPRAAAPIARPLTAGGRAFTVVRPGALTTVQDGGRIGLASLGVPRGGPLDGGSAALANRLVGNDGQAALLETTVDGVALRAGTALTIAVTGAMADLQVGGRAVSPGVAVDVPAGAEIDVGPALTCVRSYVAVAGGLAVARVLGSRCRDTLSGLGTPVLTVGDVLPVGPVVAAPPPVWFSLPAPGGPVCLRLTPGPRTDWFGPAGLAALLSATYELSPTSNRIGARLTGPAVPRRRGELDSEGMVLGAVQVPPDGLPVVLLNDHPTTGGYPVIGVVARADLDRLAQARPGTPVRFVLNGSGSS